MPKTAGSGPGAQCFRRHQRKPGKQTPKQLLTSVGFSQANVKHMADMTAAVLSGLTVAEGPETVLLTTFPEYARRYLAGMAAKQ